MNIVKEIKLVVFCSNSTIAKIRIVTRDNDHSIALTTTHYTINAHKRTESTYLYHNTPTLCGTDNDEIYVFCIRSVFVPFRVAIYRPLSRYIGALLETIM